MERNVLISISALANTPRDGSWRRDARSGGGSVSFSSQLSLGAPSPGCSAGGSPVRRRRLPLLGASATARLGCPPAPARPRRFKYADPGRRGGGGRGRKGEEGGRERSGERRGEPQPGTQGTRCESVRFPFPTPLPAAAPSPATPPPSAASPPGACCFSFKGRDCASLGALGALIYIFLYQAC